MIFIFILGLIVGSFLNAVIFRMYSGESFLSGRSYCRACKKQLQPADLVPLFSFLYLRGRCRYCLVKLSWQYPLIELTTGIIFVLLAADYGLRITDYGFWFQLVMVCFLIVIAVFDLKHYLILDKVIFPAIVLAILWNVYLDLSSSQPLLAWQGHAVLAVLAGLGVSAFFLLQYLISRGRWIGLGDVKLGLLLGLLAGWPQSLILLLLAYFSGAVVGIGLIFLGYKQLGSKLPFGVFLGSSAIIIMLYGSTITNWYYKLIGL